MNLNEQTSVTEWVKLAYPCIFFATESTIELDCECERSTLAAVRNVTRYSRKFRVKRVFNQSSEREKHKRLDLIWFI
jgi:hypothetical protein